MNQLKEALIIKETQYVSLQHRFDTWIQSSNPLTEIYHENQILKKAIQNRDIAMRDLTVQCNDLARQIDDAHLKTSRHASYQAQAVTAVDHDSSSLNLTGSVYAFGTFKPIIRILLNSKIKRLFPSSKVWKDK